MFAWLGKASPKKSSKKSKNKVENTTNGGVISKENHSNGRILSFRKLKSFKKDAQEEENEKVLSSSPSLRCEGFTKPSQSPVHSIDLALAHSKDSGVLDLNPNGNRSGHCCYPLPSPNRVTNKSDEGLHSGWESAASSTASDEHDAAPAHPPPSSGGEVKEKEGRVDVMKLTPKLAPRPQNLPISGKRGLPAKQLQIPVNRALGNATDSSMSSPSSPMRNFDPTAGIWGLKHNHDLVPTLASTNCSSPGSGANSTVGDVVGQHHRSPVLSPRFRSPGPSSRAHSNAVSPRHPRAAGTDSPKDGRNQHVCHPLPLPPRSPSSAFCNVASSSPSPRSPASRDNPASPGHRWKKGKLIGRGTFGHVYAGFNSESGEMCAMKEVTLFSDDPKSKESVNQLGQEISMLSYLRHSNIVQYYGSEMVNDTLYIYLEYVSGGSIHKLLQEYGQFGEPAIRSYTQQILSGLAYLHNKNTVHRDIKGANILVDPNGHVKLADFGMAKHISSGSCMLSFKGSPYWMAPEVFKNSNGYDLAVDIWSLGCTVIEMATARPPWSQYEGVAAMFKIGNSKELPEIPGHLSDEGKNFLKLCLQRDPADRPTAAQLLEHPFVKDANLYIRVDNTDIKEMPTGMRILQNGMQHGGHSRCPSSVEMDYCATTNRGWQHHQPLSEQFYMHKNISMPVSPSGSPLIPPRSPLHRHGGMSSSPMSTPLASSGCSTPQTGGYEAMAYQANVFSRPSMFVQENSGNIPKYLLGPNSNSNLSGMSIDTKPEILGGLISNTRTPEGSPRLQKCFAAENDVSGKMFCRKAANEAMPSPRHYSGQMALAEHVSQQLLKSPSQLTVDMKAVSSLHALQNGKELY